MDWYVYHSKKGWILLSEAEYKRLQTIGEEKFLDDIMITYFKTRKALISHYKSETFYKHIFA